MFKITDISNTHKNFIFMKHKFAKYCFHNGVLSELPQVDECFFIESCKSFNAFSFILLIIKEKKHIDELYLATYSINAQFINQLQKLLLKNQIGNIHIIITDSIKKRMPKIYEHLTAIAKMNESFKVELKWSHKKVICAKVKNDFYVVEGSGNLSDNSAIEQYLFTNNKQLYEFRRNI